MSRLDNIRQASRRVVPVKHTTAARLSVQAVLVAIFFVVSAVPTSAQEDICSTPIGEFTNGLITAALGLGLALVFLGMVVGFGGRAVAFSGSLMNKLSSMTSNSLVGLLGLVFVAVVFSWVLGYAPIDIPQGCVPLSG